MFASLRHMRSLSARTTIFAVAAILALVINVAVAFYAIKHVGIGGPAYSRVVEGKDLVADILPPPEYLIEAYLESNLIQDGRGDINRLAQLHKDFDERRAYWKTSDLPQALKVQLVEAAGGEGDRFWSELETSFLPALAKHDRAAVERSFAELSDAYNRHRAAIDRLVTMANDFAAQEEAGAKAQMPFFSWIMIGVAVIGFVILVSAVLAVRVGVVRPIVNIGREIAELETTSSNDERAVRTQLDLESMIDTVRLALEQRGKPHRSGDQLFFGSTLIHGELDFINALQSRFGCVVTIFAGDLRVATNLRQADGRSAIGTRLADEAIRSAVLRGHTAHRQSEIFGVEHITIYQPILDGSDVIGIIAVAIPTTTEQLAQTVDASANEIVRIKSAVARLRDAVQSHRTAEQESTRRRYEGTDAIRRATAVQAASAAGQQIVVAALSDALEHLASTDLTHSIAQDFPDEYVKLKANFGSATDILRSTVRLITGQAETIAGVTDEIAQAAQELSLRTERQAANVEETAAALNEITLAVKRTAVSANRTHEIMGQAKSDAEHSEIVVRDAKVAMNSIQQSSQKIAEIIGVIDGIAFQTNLLALNAGVEAARAGETGRGFAVVASEVRALAQRATEAARDIKTLISDSTSKVDEGVRLVGETGDALLRIIERVSEVNGVVAEIANSAHDQSISLHEINTAVKQVDQATQQNAAMVEETTAASTSLAEEMRALADLLRRFKIEDGDAVRQRRAA